MISQPHEHRPLDAITANRIEQHTQEMLKLVANNTSLRERLVSSYNDPRRDLNKECGYPDTNNIDITMYREQYDRNCIATRVVQVWPLESWQAQPSVYENEDPDVETPFEIAWGNLGKSLRKGFAKNKDTQGHPAWEYLRRGDILSGIGFFGGILLGVDDGKELDQPIDGFDDNAPDIQPEAEGEFSDTKTQGKNLFGQGGKSEGDDFGGEPSSSEGSDESGDAEEKQRPSQMVDGGVDDLQKKKKKKPPFTANISATDRRPFQSDDDPDEEEEETEEETEDSIDPSMEDDQGAVDLKGGAKTLGKQSPEVKTKRKLLFMRVFDESLMQVIQWVDNPNSPRFGLPKMYLITFNDPKDRQQGAGLGTQTKMVHWSRVIHLADNRGSSESAGVPRMRPVYDNLLDCKKYLGGGAEGAWKGSFPGFSLETHPQLGGDVSVDLTAARETMERYYNSLQRAIVTEGMTVNSLAPQVVDCSPQLEMEITVVCILLGIPKRVFMGSERGELASSQDDSTWNDRLADRQLYYITPHIIEPFIDRLIQIGVLPVPAEGYAVEWPDLDSLSDLEKAQVATARVNALVAFIAGDVESLIDPVDFLTKFLDIDEEEAKAMLEKAAERIKTQMDEAMENEDGLMDLRTKETEDQEAELEAQIEGAKNQPPGFGGHGGGQFPPKKPGGFPPKKEPSVNVANGCGAGEDGNPGFQKGNDCAADRSRRLNLMGRSFSVSAKVEGKRFFTATGKYPHEVSLGEFSKVADPENAKWQNKQDISIAHKEWVKAADVYLPDEINEEALEMYAGNDEPSLLATLTERRNRKPTTPKITTKPITGLAKLQNDAGKVLSDGTRVKFKEGFEYGGMTAVVSGTIPNRYAKGDRTYKLQVDGFPKPGGWDGGITKTAKNLMDGAELVDNKEAGQKSKVPFSANVDCGTGAGGFKKGNTCAAGDDWMKDQQSRLTKLANDSLARYEAIEKPNDNSYGNMTDSDLGGVLTRLNSQIVAKNKALKEYQAGHPSHEQAKADLENFTPRYKQAKEELQRRMELARLRQRIVAIHRSQQSDNIALTESEMSELLAKQGDVYVDAKLKTSKGKYPHTPDLFRTSDLTGKRIRMYLTLPDGRLAHPDELYESRQRGRVSIIPDADAPGDFSTALTAVRLSLLKTNSANVENSDCGAGSEGDPHFQPGNDCAKGGKGSSTWGEFKPLPHGDWSDLEEDEFYLYHATNLENAVYISKGEMEPHDPSYGTDQEVWPDGSEEQRSYFTHAPRVAYSFAPEEGKPVLLRVPRRAAKFKRESTGDFYTKTSVKPTDLEIIDDEGNWIPLSNIVGNASGCGAGSEGDPKFQPGNTCAKGGATSTPFISRAKVSIRPGSEREVRDLMRGWFKSTNPRILSSLVGAPNNATVEAEWDGEDVVIYVDHPDYHAVRILRDDNGRALIHNDSFDINKESRGKGLGTEIFTNQVAAAKSYATKITCIAVRSADSNGYYTWPRLGFDQSIASLPKSNRREILKAFPNATNISDVLASSDGRSWWRQHGDSLDESVFDLSNGSHSLNILESYITERAKRG